MTELSYFITGIFIARLVTDVEYNCDGTRFF